MEKKFARHVLLLLASALSLILLSAFVSAIHDTMDMNKLQPFPHCWTEDDDQTGCEANVSKGCFWHPKNGSATGSANNTWCPNATGCCRVVGCYGNRSHTWSAFDSKNETRCRSLLNDSGLPCQWVTPQMQGGFADMAGSCMAQDICFLKTGTSQNACENASFLGGKCKWVTQTASTWCWNSTGCCENQWCNSNWMQNLTKCMAASNLGQYCSWNGTNCTDGFAMPWGGDTGNGTAVNSSISGACGANSNNSVSCKSTNWCTYDNTTGACLDPYMTGTMNYSNLGVRCWFADNNPGTCRNISGCIYCIDGTNAQNNSINTRGSFCYNKTAGWCEGHQENADTNKLGIQPYEFNKSLESSKADGWLSNSSLNCSDFNATMNKVCDCGPLPGCTWNGNECRPGPSKCDLPDPPVTFCDGVMSDGNKVNETTCSDLKTKWFMNCMWNNVSMKCGFDWGDLSDNKNDTTDTNFYKITNKKDCEAAKGDWISETYCDSAGNMQTESWCEMGTGIGYDNCDDICAACEWFFPNGTPVTSLVQASKACNQSALGVCTFSQYSNAPNTFGYCNTPVNIGYGSSGKCDEKCMDCELITNNASARCNASLAGCKWDTPTSSCFSNNTLGCSVDCFACIDSASCSMSNANCSWDPNMYYCKSSGISIEVCFDTIDNDNDGKIDCGDGDCLFNSFCSGGGGGGGAGGGGDNCVQHATEAICTTTLAGQTGRNCIWIKPDWSQPYCGMPGSNCWQYDNNKTGCNATYGCNWTIPTNSFCDTNFTAMSECSKLSIQNCEANSNCKIHNDTFTNNAWCELAVFEQCRSIQTVTGCTANSNCSWMQDFWSSTLGHCEIGCFNHSLTTAQCNDKKPWCVAESGMCEPTLFSMYGGSQAGCFSWNGNQSGCITQNASCHWRADGNGPAPDRGWCEPKGTFSVFNEFGNFAPDFLLIKGGENLSISGEVDIRFATIKETHDSYLFETGVRSINNSAYCNGFVLPGVLTNTTGSGTNTTKIFYFLETDGNTLNGCSATLPRGVNHTTKFDFLIKHIVMRGTSETLETRSLQRCINDDWAPTNTVVTSSPSMLCSLRHTSSGANGAFGVTIQKESFSKFNEFNKTRPMKLFVTSAEANGSLSSPNDTGESVTMYTPGAIGFDMVDCSAPGSSATNQKCSKMKMFGFIKKEDCFSSSDDDDDGVTNCNDMDCKNEPLCSSVGVNSVTSGYYWGNDQTAPSLLFSNVDTYPDSAFIKYFSNEPANGSIEFYSTDNNCTTLNDTIKDVGILDPFLPDYKDWHDGPVDNFKFNPENISFKLTNGTVYYYKIKMCDEAGNCAASKCLNFTTAKSTLKKDCPSCNVVLKLTPPTGMNVQYDFGDGIYSQQVGTECGKKINYTQSKKAKIKIISGNLSVEFINVSLGGNLGDSAKSFNSSEMPSNAGLNIDGTVTGCIGFTQNKFDQMKSAGMIPEKLKIVIPKGTTSCNTLMQCDTCTTSASCKDITNLTGVTMINDTGTTCEWLVPGSYNFI